MPAVPTYDSIFAYDAAEVDDDTLRLSGPCSTAAPGTVNPVPPVGVTDPWRGDSGDYGLAVDLWTNATHPGYPAVAGPNKSWKFDVVIPAGTYTRYTRRTPR